MTNDKTACPVVKNQVISIEITALGAEGEGIGRFQGFVVFVPFALPGELVEARVIKVTSSWAVGKLTGVLRASPARVEPRCAAFGRCGGCRLQHMKYDSQLSFKQRLVGEALRGIGGFTDPVVLPAIGMDEPWRYRNKGTFPVGRGDCGVVTGMYAARSHAVVAVEDCPLQPVAVSLAMAAVRRWAAERRVTVYDERTGRGLLRNVLVRSFAETGETLAAVVTNGERIPAEDKLVAALRESVPGLIGVVQNVNEENTNVVLGRRERVLWGRPGVTARLERLTFEVGAASFYQVNTAQMEKLYAAAREAAGLTGRELLVDAYCGVGTIGQYMADGASKVVGIESVRQSVEEARRSAARNGIANAEYILGRAEEVLPELVAKGMRPDVVLMDPPRKGCEPRFLEAVAAIGVEKLVYISCNPATMARDARFLHEKGYALGAVQPVDMFAHTPEVETVARLERL